MTNVGRPIRRALFLAAALPAFGLASNVEAQPSTSVPGDAQPSTTGPVVLLDHATMSTGDHVVVTIDGFTSSLVTISVCGNNATRGSADCNMTASEGVKLNSDGTSTLADMPVAAPPIACPCVIRVSSQTYDEAAVSPITLIGQPIEPIVGGPNLDDPLVAVSISARATPHGALGWARSKLGGPVTFEVTVTIKNLTTETLSRVAVSGSVGRGTSHTLADLALEDPGEIGPSQTWRDVVSAKVPAPSIGSIKWRVAASGAGPTVVATQSTRLRPVLLLLMLMLLVGVLTAFAIRHVISRRAAAGPTGRAEERVMADA